MCHNICSEQFGYYGIWKFFEGFTDFETSPYIANEVVDSNKWKQVSLI